VVVGLGRPNEIVVDGRGNCYVNGGPGIVAVVTPDGTVRQVASGIAFPNGMAITADNETLCDSAPARGA
jgi:sugar lactone lactonase YvrE